MKNGHDLRADTLYSVDIFLDTKNGWLNGRTLLHAFIFLLNASTVYRMSAPAQLPFLLLKHFSY